MLPLHADDFGANCVVFCNDGLEFLCGGVDEVEVVLCVGLYGGGVVGKDLCEAVF